MNRIKKVGFVLGMLLMMSLCVSSLSSHHGTVSSSFTVVSSLDEGCEYYDTFSSETLDGSKWVEVVATDVGQGYVLEMTDEHYVENGVYHTAQVMPQEEGTCRKDRGTGLVFKNMTNNMTFNHGDTVEYDVNYISGAGNRISTMILNDNLYNGSSNFFLGYWIHTEGNNDYGTHHIKITFLSEGVNVTFTRPNNDESTHFYDEYPAEEYTFGIVTRTGHNGLVHMDYDNVVICKN